MEQWEALILYFTNLSFDAKKDIEAIKPDAILQSLRNPITKLYFLFLSHSLKLINTLNLQFQSEISMVHLIHTKMSGLFKSIVRCFMKKEYVDSFQQLSEIDIDDEANHISLDEMFVGTECELFISKKEINQQHLRDAKKNIKLYYMELAHQIKRRFDFDNPKLKMLGNFDPKIAVSGNISSLVQSLKTFPMFEANMVKINSEWRLLSEIDELKTIASKLSAEEFWYELGEMRNELKQPMFTNISKVGKTVLSLPHSTATVERKFSQQNLIKGPCRNQLLPSTTGSLMQCKDMLKYGERNETKCYEWKPSNDLIAKKISNDV